MTQFILDTDQVTLLLQGNVSIRNQIQQCPGQVAVTIITVQEIFNEWISLINARSQTHN